MYAASHPLSSAASHEWGRLQVRKEDEPHRDDPHLIEQRSCIESGSTTRRSARATASTLARRVQTIATCCCAVSRSKLGVRAAAASGPSEAASPLPFRCRWPGGPASSELSEPLVPPATADGAVGASRAPHPAGARAASGDAAQPAKPGPCPMGSEVDRLVSRRAAVLFWERRATRRRFHAPAMQAKVPSPRRGTALAALLLSCLGVATSSPVCSSGIDGDDVDTQQCFGWCNPITADAHCQWCKVSASPSPAPGGPPFRVSRSFDTLSSPLAVPRVRLVQRRAHDWVRGVGGSRRRLAGRWLRRDGRLRDGCGGRVGGARLPGLLHRSRFRAALPALQVQGVLLLSVPV
eukprot:scaffold25905_cov118-Isochrysis_galbana.AAC.2